jgi:hypothetical protein
VDRLDLDSQLAIDARRGGPRDAAVEAGDSCRGHASGKPRRIDHVGDGSDARILAVLCGSRNTRSSPLTSAATVAVMFGKTTLSSRGTRRSFIPGLYLSFR